MTIPNIDPSELKGSLSKKNIESLDKNLKMPVKSELETNLHAEAPLPIKKGLEPLKNLVAELKMNPATDQLKVIPKSIEKPIAKVGLLNEITNSLHSYKEKYNKVIAPSQPTNFASNLKTDNTVLNRIDNNLKYYTNLSDIIKPQDQAITNTAVIPLKNYPTVMKTIANDLKFYNEVAIRPEMKEVKELHILSDNLVELAGISQNSKTTIKNEINLNLVTYNNLLTEVQAGKQIDPPLFKQITSQLDFFQDFAVAVKYSKEPSLMPPLTGLIRTLTSLNNLGSLQQKISDNLISYTALLESVKAGKKVIDLPILKLITNDLNFYQSLALKDFRFDQLNLLINLLATLNKMSQPLPTLEQILKTLKFYKNFQKSNGAKPIDQSTWQKILTDITYYTSVVPAFKEQGKQKELDATTKLLDILNKLAKLDILVPNKMHP